MATAIGVMYAAFAALLLLRWEWRLDAAGVPDFDKILMQQASKSAREFALWNGEALLSKDDGIFGKAVGIGGADDDVGRHVFSLFDMRAHGNNLDGRTVLIAYVVLSDEN